jgi:hypothetical protein
MSNRYYEAFVQVLGVEAQGHIGDPKRRKRAMTEAGKAGVKPDEIDAIQEIVRLQHDFTASQKKP